jgi:cardiolipin synthase
MKLENLPNLLTYFRILIIPVVFGLFYVDESLATWAIFTLFIAASITDYLDGYFARKFNVVSPLGKCLDPIADKLLVATVIVGLLWQGMLGYYAVIPALLIILREILVSGLREFLASRDIAMPVTKLAKWKTAMQMFALPILIIQNFLPAEITFAGVGLLWIAAILTAITGCQYLKFTIRSLK